MHHLMEKKIDESEFCFHVSRQGFTSNEIAIERERRCKSIERDPNRHREQVRFKKERQGISEWMLVEYDNE